MRRICVSKVKPLNFAFGKGELKWGVGNGIGDGEEDERQGEDGELGKTHLADSLHRSRQRRHLHSLFTKRIKRRTQRPQHLLHSTQQLVYHFSILRVPSSSFSSIPTTSLSSHSSTESRGVGEPETGLYRRRSGEGRDSRDRRQVRDGTRRTGNGRETRRRW